MIVHRDLKPANILIASGTDHAEPEAGSQTEPRAEPRAEPMIKVVDFGVSALSSNEVGEPALAETVDGAQAVAGGLLTQTGVIMGTPLYMAPELVWGAKRARSDADIFSFGVIAYELLTGQPPSEIPPIMMRLKPSVRWYAPLSLRCPGHPERLGRLIEQCLDAAPENRPTAAELHTAFGGGEGAGITHRAGKP